MLKLCYLSSAAHRPCSDDAAEDHLAAASSPPHTGPAEREDECRMPVALRSYLTARKGGGMQHMCKVKANTDDRETMREQCEHEWKPTHHCIHCQRQRQPCNAEPSCKQSLRGAPARRSGAPGRAALRRALPRFARLGSLTHFIGEKLTCTLWAFICYGPW